MENDLTVEWMPINRVVPYARNARNVTDVAVAKVAASIREFGWRQPIVVDEQMVILAGHTRLLAALYLQLTEVPVHVARGLSPAQAKAYRLLDNRAAQETTWNEELLILELEDLVNMDVDLETTGFDKEELARLRAAKGTTGLTDPDSAPALPRSPVSRPGDQWLLGRHRLRCGDSTASEDVVNLMDGKRAGLMATDPPYLVDYKGGTHPPTVANGGIVDGVVVGVEEKNWDAYVDPGTSIDFFRDFLVIAREEALTINPAIYQWFATARVELVLAAWRAAGLLPHQQLVWRKTRAVLTRSDYMWDYEPFLYGWIRGRRPGMRPPAASKAVWEVASREGIEEGAGNDHPTMKPVELQKRCLEYHTLPGGLCYEPFSGSGTCIIAAEMTGRTCFAMELAPAFVDVAVMRWQNFTGNAAMIEGGSSFDETMEQRR